MNQPLSTMKPTNSHPTTSQPTNDLNKVINESRNEIHQATEETLAKKRGRPSGNKKEKTNAPPLDLQANPQTQQMSIEGYKMMLSGIVNLSSLYLNKYSETNCFTLEKEEVEMITTSGADCMMEFIPTVNTKYMKLAGFGICLVSIYGMKYSSFVQVHEKKIKDVKNEVSTN